MQITTKVNGKVKTFSVPMIHFDEIEENIGLLNEMESDSKSQETHNQKKDVSSALEMLSALPACSKDPLEVFLTVGRPAQSYIDDYWSTSGSFWSDWQAKEASTRKASLEKAKSSLAESQKEAATAAALLAREAEHERAEKQQREAAEARRAQEKAQKATIEIAKVQSVPPLPDKAHASGESRVERFDHLMEEGKQFRSEFIQTWREVSLAVSTTAGNARSIQFNASKLITALSRIATQAGSNRPSVVPWMAAVCGSKIVSQASSGNKILVWSFAYLARMVSDKFPDTIRIGFVGQLIKDAPYVSSGLPWSKSSRPSAESPKEYEMHTRIFVAILCVCCDEGSLWAWVAHSVNRLIATRTFISSNEALWNMMKLYVLVDMGLYDFRRVFGSKASFLLAPLEEIVLPALGRELQSLPQQTSVSVQYRFYMDACYNNFQSRNYMKPPDGQTLSATKEADLNPEL